MMEIRTQWLSTAERAHGRELFAMMAEVFGEETERLEDDYLDELLSREDFWAIAAFAGDDIVGGITAHTLPMTSTASSEVFIYDIAVREQQQRRGIGRALVNALRDAAASAGIDVVFVAADNTDTHALDFYRALGGAASPVTFFTFSAG